MKPILGLPLRLSTSMWLNVVFAVVTAMLALVGWLIAVGLQNQLSQLVRSRAEGMALLQRTDEMHASYQSLKQQTTAAKQFLDSLRTRLPDSPEETAFLQQLSELASATGLELSDYRPGGITDRRVVKEMELQVRGTGRHAGQCRLLAGLGDLPRIVRVSQLTIVAPLQPGGDCSIDLQLHLLFGLNAGGPVGTAVQP